MSQLSVASKKVDVGKSIAHEVVKTKEYVLFNKHNTRNITIMLVLLVVLFLLFLRQFYLQISCVLFCLQ